VIIPKNAPSHKEKVRGRFSTKEMLEEIKVGKESFFIAFSVWRKKKRKSILTNSVKYAFMKSRFHLKKEEGICDF